MSSIVEKANNSVWCWSVLMIGFVVVFILSLPSFGDFFEQVCWEIKKSRERKNKIRERRRIQKYIDCAGGSYACAKNILSKEEEALDHILLQTKYKELLGEKMDSDIARLTQKYDFYQKNKEEL